MRHFNPLNVSLTLFKKGYEICGYERDIRGTGVMCIIQEVNILKGPILNNLIFKLFNAIEKYEVL